MYINAVQRRCSSSACFPFQSLLPAQRSYMLSWISCDATEAVMTNQHQGSWTLCTIYVLKWTAAAELLQGHLSLFYLHVRVQSQMYRAFVFIIQAHNTSKDSTSHSSKVEKVKGGPETRTQQIQNIIHDEIDGGNRRTQKGSWPPTWTALMYIQICYWECPCFRIDSSELRRRVVYSACLWRPVLCRAIYRNEIITHDSLLPRALLLFLSPFTCRGNDKSGGHSDERCGR